jgi:hypothetical protein
VQSNQAQSKCPDNRQVPADEFPRVETLRRELRALPFVRLDDTELSHLRARLLFGHHNNALEGIEPSPEMAALFAMFLQERAPLPVAEPFLDRYIREVLV